jgi:hypothetical protein
MVFAIALGPHAILFVVVVVAWHNLVGVDLLDVVEGRL